MSLSSSWTGFAGTLTSRVLFKLVFRFEDSCSVFLVSIRLTLQLVEQATRTFAH